MGKIKVLDYRTANKIAAGEVVESPLSIVKELIENSIDAGATSIKIFIENGGISKLVIVDNGHGMSKEDLAVAFEKHATSKIINIEDLLCLNTLGFRGEALSSISSVAKVAAKSKMKENVSGHQIIIHGGNIQQEVTEVGCQDGTIIEVADLFYNTPARLKYLNNPGTYTASITDLISKFALAYPEISFKLGTNHREILQTSGNGKLLEVIASVWGINVINNLVPVKFSDDITTIEGYISKPNYYRSNRKWQAFFVNDRIVKNELLTKSLDECYKTLLPVRSFPVAVLSITMAPEKLDVNVHPAKTIIRFEKEQQFIKTFNQALSNILLKETNLSDKITRPQKEPVKKPIEPTISYQKQVQEPRHTSIKIAEPHVAEEVKEAEEVEVSEPPTLFREVIDDFRILGQLDNSYILYQQDSNLCLVDQHAAHERIIYNTLIKKIENKNITTQQLVIPVSLELSVDEVEILTNYISELRDLGFLIEHFGHNTFVLREVPIEIETGQEEATFRQIIESFEKKQKPVSQKELYHNTFTLISCKKAIKAGQKLSSQEMNHIIKELLQTNNGTTCPHGRPTVITFESDFLARKFLRQ